jgi:hypothetical protein
MTHPHERALEAAARAIADYRYLNFERNSDFLVAHARAAVTAYIAEAGDGWMPIETAPKDGTRVMLWMEPMNDARFKPTDGPHAVFGTWVVWSDAMKRDGMRDGWSWYGSPLHWPTHWAPLPAPPSAQEKK